MRSKVVRYDSIPSLSDRRVSFGESLFLVVALAMVVDHQLQQLCHSMVASLGFFLVAAAFLGTVVHHRAHDVDEACDVAAG